MLPLEFNECKSSACHFTAANYESTFLIYTSSKKISIIAVFTIDSKLVKLYYINTKIQNTGQKLHLFSVGWPGQNKNHKLVRFLLASPASKRFEKLCHYFPVRGHPYLPCNRDFGTIKRNVRKHRRIYLPQEYEDMITSSIKSSKRLFFFHCKNGNPQQYCRH